MPWHRFFVPTLPGENPSPLPAEAVTHITRVLRLRAGEIVELFDGQGHACHAKLTAVKPRAASARHIASLPQEPPVRLPVHLLLALSKGERMDFALQKAVELGVTAITPVLTARTVVRLDRQRAAKRLIHWRRVLIAACEQSGRNRLPTLDAITPLDTALNQSDAPLRLVLDPRARDPIGALRNQNPEAIACLSGPEGGLEENEIQQAGQHGFRAIRLGPRILRAETAPIALLAAAQTLWGDFQ